jgi:hypothetical protein
MRSEKGPLREDSLAKVRYVNMYVSSFEFIVNKCPYQSQTLLTGGLLRASEDF